MTEPLAIVWSRPLPAGARPSTITVTIDCAHRYFVSILIEEDIKQLAKREQSLGADLGLKEFVILSTGEVVGNPQFFRKDEKKLAQAQRRHARTQKGSQEPCQGTSKSCEDPCPHC